MSSLWPLNNTCKHSSKVIADIKDQKASNGNKVLVTPLITMSCTFDQNSNGGEHGQSDQKTDKHRQNPNPDAFDNSQSTHFF